ncbi:cysteine-rich CWC family protein [Shewanella sp. JNE10-2]|uniref:cysteine-rich CWC family protein n=1 Tax=Shewanella TaxID=22 RepID=UPI002002D451|nr:MULTISPECIES: cysteine-rich CWC family protein [unclassified Shewanella]MCK7628839.1 cysteine-rich CWC family protein [Shewanella sp. JNE9-1]MCK7634894.1 cysteine-rich CWC family protein [Shewanella sp. JNE17]MCK7644088.1 cysteine-rich CWC family protein [Shewanella sp. JNE3-1]MCK7650183.1 cysteine-rich CWC family protein [Shewanella sp. JNE8]MCK7652273.1 cysteine-rich CWC family protein [Shewanella sp. JNE4-1]
MSQRLEEPKLETAQICPLCQGANQCAVILGKGIKDCWCALQTFPPLAALQAQASGSLQGALSPILPPSDACICQACLSQLKLGLSQDQLKAQDEKSPSSVRDGLGYEAK